MSAENVEIVRRGFAHYRTTGDFPEELIAPGFVWDMSTFRDWPERQIYEGLEGAKEFLADWTDAWDDWSFDVEEFHDGGEMIVAVIRQRGRSKTTGLEVDMHFAQIWTVENGKQTRMRMYASPDEALDAAGIAEAGE